jgi:enoyl-CoA hydratase
MVQREDCGAVAVLRLAHGRANALDPEVLGALGQALEAAASARAVILTGAGTMFSAGVDLKRLAAGGPDYPTALVPALVDCFARLFYHPRPVVAAINGHAVAGGCVIACAADRRLAARGGARLGVTELLVGVPFPAIALEIMRAAIPSAHFAETVYQGRTWGVEDAERRGLVDAVVEPDRLLDAAVA